MAQAPHGISADYKDKLLSLAYTVEIATAPVMTLRPARGALFAAGVSLAPAAGLQ